MPRRASTVPPPVSGSHSVHWHHGEGHAAPRCFRIESATRPTLDAHDIDRDLERVFIRRMPSSFGHSSPLSRSKLGLPTTYHLSSLLGLQSVLRLASLGLYTMTDFIMSVIVAALSGCTTLIGSSSYGLEEGSGPQERGGVGAICHYGRLHQPSSGF